MTDTFPYQLCEWQKKRSDLDSVLETLIKYNEPYEIRQYTKEGEYKAFWKDCQYCYAVFTRGLNIIKGNDYRKP